MQHQYGRLFNQLQKFLKGQKGRKNATQTWNTLSEQLQKWFSGLSLVLKKRRFWLACHQILPLVEVNQAIDAWSFRQGCNLPISHHSPKYRTHPPEIKWGQKGSKEQDHCFCSSNKFHQIESGSARTLDPTNKNYAPELSTFGIIIEVSQSEVQWASLALEKPPS